MPDASKPKKPRAKLNLNLTAEERELVLKKHIAKATCATNLTPGVQCKRKFRESQERFVFLI